LKRITGDLHSQISLEASPTRRSPQARTMQLAR
jgi:hypothetical protein